MVRSNHSGLAYYTFVNSPVKGCGQIGGLMWCHEFIPLLASSSASATSASEQYHAFHGNFHDMPICLHSVVIWRNVARLVEEQKANCLSLQDLLHLVHQINHSNSVQVLSGVRCCVHISVHWWSVLADGYFKGFLALLASWLNRMCSVQNSGST